MWTSFLKWRKRSFETVLTYVIYHLCSPYLYLIIHFLLVLTISFGIYNLAVHSIWHLPTLILPHFLACQIFLILSYLVLTFRTIFRNVLCSLCLCSLPFFDFYCFKTEVNFFYWIASSPSLQGTRKKNTANTAANTTNTLLLRISSFMI